MSKNAKEYAEIIPDEIIIEVGSWIEKGRHGHITINFCGGATPNMNVSETKKIMCTKKQKP